MKLYCIGIGPGGVEQMTLRAARALEKCDCVAGYGLYLELIAELIEGKERIQTGMTKEVDRCTAARDAARAGRTVAVVSSGDAGVYGMAGLLRRAIFASRFITPAAKRAPAICAAPAISCSRPCRRKPCAGWRAASAVWAKAIR